MKSLDRDIIELERYFRRLRGYLSECALPLARLVSISHFVLYLDESFDDSGYYLPEVAPLFRESLSMWDPDTRPDPAHVDLIRSAANVFVATGIMSEAILPNTPDSGPDSPPETSLREPSPTALFTQVFIPVVQEVLIPPGVRDFAEGVGIVVTLTVAPRTSSGSGGVILLRSESGDVPQNRHDPLCNIAREALIAAEVTIASADVPGAPPRTHGQVAYPLDFAISFSEKNIPITGDSLGLGLAIAFAGVLRGARDCGHALRPRPEITWTGQALPSGECAQVDRRSLACKLRASHFRGCRTVVVPEGMGRDAETLCAEHRLPLQIVEVGALREVLQRTDLLEDWQLPDAIWQKPSAARAQRWWPILIGASLAVAGIYGWQHRNAWLPSATQESPAVARTKSEQDLGPIFSVALSDNHHAIAIRNTSTGSVDLIRTPSRIAFHGTSVCLDADLPQLDAGVADPSHVLVYATLMNPQAGLPGQVVVYDMRRKQSLWSYEFTSSGLPGRVESSPAEWMYSIKHGDIGDVDGDGRDEFVVAGSWDIWSGSFLWLFDGGCLPRGVVYHVGHLEDVRIYDIDSDGRAEIIAAGIHNESHGLSVIVLTPQQFEPYAGIADGDDPFRVRESWDLGRQPCVLHLVIPKNQAIARMPGLGRPALLGSGAALDFRHHPNGVSKILLNVVVSEDKPRLTDYIVSIHPPRNVIQIHPTTEIKEREEHLVAEGLPPAGLSSDSLLTAWRAEFRCTRYVQLGWD